MEQKNLNINQASGSKINTELAVPIFQSRRRHRPRQGLKRKKGFKRDDDSGGSSESSNEDMRDNIPIVSGRKKTVRLNRLQRESEQFENSALKDINVEYQSNLSATGESVNTTTVSAINEDTREVILGRPSPKLANQSTLPTELFQSQNDYSRFLPKRKDFEKKSQVGPVLSSNASTVRMNTIIDYQPDVCKDYKLTGYCGYGDTCKFLHMREDYKAGWQLDREWDSVQEKYKKGAKLEEGMVKNEKKEDIPFVCLICKKDYRSPIATTCGHHFCEQCAITRYRKTPTCIQCGADTKGLFSVDKNFDRLLKNRKSKNDEAVKQKVGGFESNNSATTEVSERKDREASFQGFADTLAKPNTSAQQKMPSLGDNSNTIISKYFIREITESNIVHFKRLVRVVLEASYSDKFYRLVLKNPDYARIATFEDKFVGAISSLVAEDNSLYVTVLCVLAPYRCLGIGSLLIDHVKKTAINNNIDRISLHVQTTNESVIKWYTAHGFKIVKQINDFYRRLENKSAFYMVCPLSAHNNIISNH
ncbi:Pre-mRNA-splicing factor cwf24 [Schizosaccharomyces pombe]|uniref:Pre-mRNA-splicing factor cwf24 n=1 Tax=Schizosaccharomyces pombe (strain 972 / ATCC 24843) TaxID=284812 RepID=CWC24_SCHPO|nr:zf-C3HC4 domain-containing and GCN5-like protein cwf24 [Schizosaccharomyces pombe]Q9P6R8.1 RecName: Full=Pre-mRNA-splicing factor cwf24; AltName: Full=Complexed with cdc5 protein 24 [Schizosaccharomyces pombe 972h-]CAB89877.1 zf-C3HC4 type (RING finger)/GCN5-related N acetyltransferase fusion protein [Schizosaccharomyces pombe]|eukprot:NP_596257.1 zf-C3HC4 domain-containing and GCN5-like protein cwf24 [Schizosaccharomyces pombe]